jgi:hypothetical protein
MSDFRTAVTPALLIVGVMVRGALIVALWWMGVAGLE